MKRCNQNKNACDTSRCCDSKAQNEMCNYEADVPLHAVASGLSAARSGLSAARSGLSAARMSETMKSRSCSCKRIMRYGYRHARAEDPLPRKAKADGPLEC